MMTHWHTSRRGSIYVLVLIVSIIVTMIGILALRMVQSQARVARLHAQRDKAAALAESAVQWGVHLVTLRDGWRSTITSGSIIRTMDLGEGQISVTITDTVDGDLTDNDSDEFIITGTGTIGDAVQTLSLAFEIESGAAHPALNESLTVGGTLFVDPNVLTLESGGTAQSLRTKNGSLYLLFPVVATESPVDYPDPMLISRWASKGTLITRAMHGGNVKDATLSSTAAPYGLSPDPNGIYIIDAENHNLDIDTCSVIGTVVVINLNDNNLDIVNTRFNFGSHGGPTLISDGETRIKNGFATGVSQGILYIDGLAIIEAEFMLVGTMIVTGNLEVATTYVSINDHPSAVAGPPEGFTEIIGLRAVPGSWKRVVN